MAEEQEPKPRFWQMLFLGAFASGAILWCMWMMVIVQKTERIRSDTMIYPPASQSAPAAASNGLPKVTNESAPSSNSASSAAK